MDSRKAKKVMKEIAYNLEIILSNESLYSKVSMPDFRKNIIRQLSMIKQLIHIQKTSSEDYLVDLVDKFNLFLPNNKITLTEIEPSSFKEESEFVDESNFLKVYIANTFGRDFTSYSHNADNIKKLSKLDYVAPLIVDQKNSSSSENQFNNAHVNESNKEYSSPFWNIDPNMIKESAKSQLINRRISEDYVKGNYYFYTSKPAAIPIIKKASSIVTIIIGIIFLTTVILGIIATSWQLKYIHDGTTTIIGISLLGGILIALAGCSLIYSGIRQLKPIKNDNFKYTYNNFNYYMLFILGVLLLMFSIPSIPMEKKVFDQLYEEYDASKVNVYKAYVYLNYVSSGLFVAQVIFPILNNVYKPLPNIELRQKLYEKYSKEIDDAGLLK